MNFYFLEGQEGDAMVQADSDNAAWDIAKYDLSTDPHSLAGPYASEAELLESHDAADADSNY